MSKQRNPNIKMSRVSTHSIKQASLNLKDMVDKKNIGIETSDLEEIISGDKRLWTKEEEKPEVFKTIIEQIRGLFNVGSEVEDWTVSYSPPPTYNTEKKTYSPSETRVSAGGKGLGARFIVVVGSRDIANLSLAYGSTDAESPYLVMSGDCLQLKLAVCPIMDIYFNNINNEKMAPRKGFRETMIKKNVGSRHVLVFDAHVEVSAIASKVKDLLLEKKGVDIGSS